MISKSRFYLKVDEGLRRLPKTVRDSKHALPQFAGTKQKMIVAYYDRSRLVLKGSYIRFDSKGYWESEQSGEAVVDLQNAVDGFERARRMKVPDLTMARKAKALAAQHLWKVSDADCDAILADLATGTRHKAIPILRPLRPI